MRSLAMLACLTFASSGCSTTEGDLAEHEAAFYRQKFRDEINEHYKTQQIKNAEIAAREVEIENQKVFIGILSDRIDALDAEHKVRAALILELKAQTEALNRRVADLERKSAEKKEK